MISSRAHRLWGLALGLLAVVTVTVTVTEAASRHPSDPQRLYDRCVQKASREWHGAMATGTVEGCSNLASEAATKEINALYGKMHERLSRENPADAQRLETAQKAWLDYRELHCALAGSYVGSPMYAFCPLQLDILRVKELRELVGE